MPKAQVIHKKGPPSCMQWEEWNVPDPSFGEVRIKHTAIGVNYADTYHRAGISHPWPVPEEPVVIGFEGVGNGGSTSLGNTSVGKLFRNP